MGTGARLKFYSPKLCSRVTLMLEFSIDCVMFQVWCRLNLRLPRV
jgi:hypothetical protein